MAEEGSHNEEQIITIKSFHKEVETLELVFQRMLKAVQESDMSDAEVSLQHLLLLDAGADEALETIRDAVQHARAVCQHVLQLNRQLRGADILAERVKQLKARVKSMEALVERTLKE